jgi:hypothetical protein
VTRRYLAGAALVWLGFFAAPTRAAAEFQVKPFVGLTFGASTTLVDPASGHETRHVAMGISALYLGDIFGVEAEVSQVPKFFQRSDADLTLRSVVNTVSGRRGHRVCQRSNWTRVGPAVLPAGDRRARPEHGAALRQGNAALVLACVNVVGGEVESGRAKT